MWFVISIVSYDSDRLLQYYISVKILPEFICDETLFHSLYYLHDEIPLIVR